MRHFFLTLSLLFAAAVAGCTKADTAAGGPVPDAGPPRARLLKVGPTLLSNQTSQPLTVVGEQLRAGLKLRVGGPSPTVVPLTVLDERHAYGRLPAGLELGTAAEGVLPVSLEGGDGQGSLRLVNDVAFPDVTALAMSRSGEWLFAASTPEDVVYALQVATKKVTRLSVGDGPTALADWKDSEGREWLVVAYEWSKELSLLSVGDLGATRLSIAAPASVSGLLVDVAGTAFVAEHKDDTVSAFSLHDGKPRWRTPVAPNPRALAVLGDALVVGSTQTGLLEVLDLKTGAPRRALQPKPGTPIIGGGTERYSSFIIGGSAPRALLAAPAAGRLFLTSIGPNLGPNPDKLEVSMNSGVAVVDPGSGWVRHLGFGAGVTEGLAYDEARGLLYTADVALGLVRVLDARLLLASDEAAATALVQEIAVPPPEGFPTVRPREDFTQKGRAGPSLHSGPRVLALSPDGKRLFVLNRFTGTVAVLDVARAKEARSTVVAQLPLTDTLQQRTRRLGQVLYFADLGRTAMSCDACHPEGHTGGVLFEKTQPLRLYRSSTVRGSRETPPYFTPASTHSMGETAKVVGGRNRFHNPDPTPGEIEALTVYISGLTTLPNPFVGEDGAPLESLRLPDGAQGRPRVGLHIFEGKGGCAECHPAPWFSTDQDAATRGRYLDVGTPHALLLRAALQDLKFEGFAPPSLVGAWDVFPLLSSGAGGLQVADGSLVVNDRFPLRRVSVDFAPRHGRADLLNNQERNDLLAYLLSL